MEVTNISLDDLQSPSRKVELVDARAVLVWLILISKLCNTNELARFLNRDLTSIGRLEKRAQDSLTLRQIADQITLTLPRHAASGAGPA